MTWREQQSSVFNHDRSEVYGQVHTVPFKFTADASLILLIGLKFKINLLNLGVQIGLLVHKDDNCFVNHGFQGQA